LKPVLTGKEYRATPGENKLFLRITSPHYSGSTVSGILMKTDRRCRRAGWVELVPRGQGHANILSPEKLPNNTIVSQVLYGRVTRTIALTSIIFFRPNPLAKQLVDVLRQVFSYAVAQPLKVQSRLTVILRLKLSYARFNFVTCG
jgi:hypothetical protein